jgi:predicted dehydrogenase
MASALVASGRHELIAYTGQIVSPSVLSRWGAAARPVGDLEEVLADPVVEAVIVAGSPRNRPAQLRRALQSERHVLCVHPADRTPDAAYEAAMIQTDTGRVLLAILPDRLHPALDRFAQMLRQSEGPVGVLRLLEVACAAIGEFLLEPAEINVKWALPAWDRLRALGGEILEVSALSPQEDLEPGQPLLLSGVFESGAMLQTSFLSNAPQPSWRATATGEHGRAELLFPLGWEGPSFLSWRGSGGELREAAFAPWDPWPVLVEVFESAVAATESKRAESENPQEASTQYSVLSTPATEPSTVRAPLAWQDAIRCLELDDAARRSVARRRSSTLEYPEASEEVGFKGTMTMLGCGLLWSILVLLILSRWVPWLGWFIIPVLIIFIALQGLRWIVRRRPEEE